MTQRYNLSFNYAKAQMIHTGNDFRVELCKQTTHDNLSRIRPGTRCITSNTYFKRDINHKMNIHPLNDAQTEWRLTLGDDIDLETYRRLEQQEVDAVCQTLFRAGAAKLIVDLTANKRLDSLGLQLLLLIYKKCAEKEVQMTLLNPSSQIRRILRILQFDRIFVIEQDEDGL